MSKDMITQAVADGHAQYSISVVGYGYLSDGNGVVVVDAASRLVNYYQSSEEGIRVVASAPLWELANIPLADIQPGQVIRVALGYPYNNGPFSVLFQVNSESGLTLNQKATDNAATPITANIQDWKVAALPGFSEIQIAVGHYVKSGTTPAKFTGDSRFADTSITSRIGALASGKHAICWVFFDQSAQIIRTAVSSAVTALNGTIANSWNEFIDADFQSVAAPNSSCHYLVPVHIYYGQTSIDHIYDDWDQRFDFPLPGVSGSGDFRADGSVPMTGDLNHDGHAALDLTFIEIVEGSAPSDPASGLQRVFIDTSDHHLKRIDHSGTTKDLESGGASTDYILLQDQKSSGTNGGTFSSGAWRTRDMNTIVDDTTGLVTVSSNQFVLQAGTYRVRAWASSYQVGRNMLRLQNITDSSTVLTGMSSFNGGGQNNQTVALLTGRFTIAGTKTFELQHQSEASMSTYGFGVASGGGFTVAHEVYAELELIKE